MTAETPAVDLDAIRALLAQPSPSNLQYGWGVSVTTARALLGMVDTLTAALTEIADIGRPNHFHEAGGTCSQCSAYHITTRALAGMSPTPPVCKHGDQACPCPDGDPCHYEGADAFPSPICNATHASTPNDPPATLEVQDEAATNVGTRDLAALADQWEAEASRRIERMGPEFSSYLSARYGGVAETLESCAAELRAALGVPRYAGSKEDPVMKGTCAVSLCEKPVAGTLDVVGKIGGEPPFELPVCADHLAVGGAPTTEPDAIRRTLREGMRLLSHPCDVVVIDADTGRVQCYPCQAEHTIDREQFERGKGPWQPSFVGIYSGPWPDSDTTEPDASTCGSRDPHGPHTHQHVISDSCVASLDCPGRDPDTTGGGGG